MGGHDDPLTELRFLTRHSEVVVTLTALATDSRLTNDGDWIESTMRGEVIDVLRTQESFRYRLEPCCRFRTMAEKSRSTRGLSERDRFPPINHSPDAAICIFCFESRGQLLPLPPFIHSSCEGNPFAD